MPGMTGRDVPPSLKDLRGRLEAARSRQEEKRGASGRGESPVAGSGLGFGLRIAVDLLAGLAIGVGLGLVLDNWLDSTPLMMVVFLFLGAAAGMLNVYRAATGRGLAVGYRKDGSGEDEPGDSRPPQAGKAEPPGSGSRDGSPRQESAAGKDWGGKS